jgi:beta-glucosidase/6-phospho-beta-glucosidase/beta-galactosidase
MRERGGLPEALQSMSSSHSASSLFQSFWMAGFESACHVNRKGHRLDMIAATQHDRFIRQDYAQLLPFNIRTVRDTLRWHLIEPRSGRYDFSSLDGQLDAARGYGIQVIWDLCHYGWPDGLDIFSAAFVDRFAAFSRAATRYLRERVEGPLLLTPINEISFFAWAAAEVGWFHPFGERRGGELKRQLVRAMIASIDAIREVDREARIVTAEPVIHVVAPKGKPDVDEVAARYREAQFEAWDMLCGRAAPELGGHSSYLDVVGVNFYHDNQWEHPGGEKIHWHIAPRDPRWMPLNVLLGEVYERYRKPLLIAETSHVGIGRAAWIRELTDEICIALEAGIPLHGVCLYPIVDRFEWENPDHWHNSGLWDYEISQAGEYHRVLNEEYAIELRACQARVNAVLANRAPLTVVI